jgi:hypothetical protein
MTELGNSQSGVPLTPSRPMVCPTAAGECVAEIGLGEKRVQRSEPSPEHVDAEEYRPSELCKCIRRHPGGKGVMLVHPRPNLPEPGRCG